MLSGLAVRDGAPFDCHFSVVADAAAVVGLASGNGAAIIAAAVFDSKNATGMYFNHVAVCIGLDKGAEEFVAAQVDGGSLAGGLANTQISRKINAASQHNQRGVVCHCLVEFGFIINNGTLACFYRDVIILSSLECSRRLNVRIIPARGIFCADNQLS